MNREEVLKEIQIIIADLAELEVEEVKEESNLAADLGIESLDFADLITSFEEKFELKIPDKDFKKLQTVKDIVDYIVSK